MNEPVFQATKMMSLDFKEKSAHWSMKRPHYHDSYEIYLQTEGVREISFQHKHYLLNPGTLCLIKPHILHLTKNHNDDGVYSRYLLNFSERIFYDFLSEHEVSLLLKDVSSFIIQLNDEQMTEALRHIYNIFDYWNLHLAGVSRGKKLAYIEIYRSLDHLLRLIQSKPEAIEITEINKISDSPIYDVLFYMETHFYEDLQLKDMIKRSHMSKSSFYRDFKQITGDSFNHYLNNYRAIKAHKLILDGKLSLQKIAEATGFSSTAHMTRIFRGIHGISPSEYRKTL